MKKTWVRKTLSVGVLAAGALLFAPAAAAQADEIGQLTAGNSGIGTGNQISLPITVPVNLVGNSAAVAGFSQARGVGNNVLLENGRSGRGTDVDQLSAGNSGLLTGNQISVPITVPVNVSGNSAAVLGKSTGVGVGNNVLFEESARAESGVRHNDRRGGGVDSVGQISAGNSGFLTGNQLSVPITVPINACGNSLALLGASQAVGVCNNVVGVPSTRKSGWNLESKKGKHAENGCCDNGRGGDRGTRVGQLSAGNRGFLTGNQISAPITVPINACGNSLGALLGSSTAVGACNNVIVDGDTGRKQIRWIKPGSGKPIFGDDVWGDDGVRGDHGHRPYPGRPDVDDDKGGYGPDDDGDVRGDKGYNDDDKGNAPDGYGDEQPDAVDNDGYGGTKPDKYGDKGGRNKMTENSPVGGLTERLGGVGSTDLGGLNLLQAVR